MCAHVLSFRLISRRDKAQDDKGRGGKSVAAGAASSDKPAGDGTCAKRGASELAKDKIREEGWKAQIDCTLGI
jgi:hypothetical protein